MRTAGVLPTVARMLSCFIECDSLEGVFGPGELKSSGKVQQQIACRDENRKATASAKANADPCGMTSKRTSNGNGNGNGKCKCNGKCKGKRRSLRDDNQKDKQRQ